jgi:3-oxoadipate enol-lactonase
MIAMGLALDHPDRVDRLVVADARADAPPPYVALWDSVIERAHTEGMAAVVDASLQRWFTPAFVEQRPPALDRLRAAAIRTTIEGLEGCGRALQQLDYLPRLPAITAPTLFVTGEHDGPAPPDTMRAMAAAVPTAGELVVIPQAGHLSAVEQPDAFTAAVTAFL